LTAGTTAQPGQRRSTAARRPRVYFLWWQDIVYSRNAVFFQRLRLIADAFELVQIGPWQARVCPELAPSVKVVRLPVPRVSIPGLAGVLRLAYVGLAAAAVAFGSRLRRPGTGVYTFQSLEASGAALLALLGYTWIADILDLPEEQFLTMQGSGVKGYFNYAVHRWHIAVLRRLLRRARLVATVGWSQDNGLAPYLLDRYAVDPQRLLSLPNGVDPALLEEPPGRSRIDGRFVVFYVGSIVERLGAETLLTGFAAAAAEISEMRLVLAGPVGSAFRRRFSELVEQLGISPRTQVLGSVPNREVLDRIRDSDVCVYPFLPGEGVDETIPVKVFEYLALARPVVASDLRGIRPILRSGENALLFTPGDSAALARSLIQLYRDHALWERLSASGPATAARFDWEKIQRPLLKRLAAVLA
jgi:glycosyltransferase involved in cell wall biosynthesis